MQPHIIQLPSIDSVFHDFPLLDEEFDPSDEDIEIIQNEWANEIVEPQPVV